MGPGGHRGHPRKEKKSVAGHTPNKKKSPSAESPARDYIVRSERPTSCSRKGLVRKSGTQHPKQYPWGGNATLGAKGGRLRLQRKNQD